MYDYLFVTHLPSFYKVNLYNELAKRLKIFVIFVASASAMRTDDFVSTNIQFDHQILFNGNFEERPKFKTALMLFQMVSRLDFNMAVVAGWDLCEFWAVVLTHSKSRNAIYVESTIAESTTIGLKSVVKKLFVSRIGTAFPSGEMHRQLLKALGFFGKVYPTGGVGIFDRQERRFQVRASAERFLYVGRLAPEKNLKMLVEVFNELPHLHLTVVGSGPLQQDLESTACGNVRFLSHVPNHQISGVYQSHDIFVLPSLREPWGLVVDEALYYGLPVIVSTNVGCHTELVNEGITGLTFNPVSKDGLKEAIVTLAEPAVFQRMSAAVTDIDFNQRDEAQISAYVEASELR